MPVNSLTLGQHEHLANICLLPVMQLTTPSHWCWWQHNGLDLAATMGFGPALRRLVPPCPPTDSEGKQPTERKQLTSMLTTERKRTSATAAVHHIGHDQQKNMTNHSTVGLEHDRAHPPRSDFMYLPILSCFRRVRSGSGGREGDCREDACAV